MLDNWNTHSMRPTMPKTSSVMYVRCLWIVEPATTSFHKSTGSISGSVLVVDGESHL